MNNLMKLSLKAHVKIRNQCIGFSNVSELTVWHLEVEHCSHRGDIYNFEDKDLDILLQNALDQMNKIEQNYKEKADALGVLYPDKNEYEIADMASNFMNKETLTQLANQALNSGQMVANYPDPDNPKVTFPPSPYYRFLRLLAGEINSNLSVELGVCGGGGSLHLAMSSKLAVGVDVTYHEYEDNMKWLTKHYKNLHFFTGDSIEFALYIYGRFGEIDILFVDTIHTYERTVAECREWGPYLSDKAVVILDDLFRPGMDLVWQEMPEPKVRFDFLHPSQSPTDGGFGVIWK